MTVKELRAKIESSVLELGDLILNAEIRIIHDSDPTICIVTKAESAALSDREGKELSFLISVEDE